MRFSSSTEVGMCLNVDHFFMAHAAKHGRDASTVAPELAACCSVAGGLSVQNSRRVVCTKQQARYGKRRCSVARGLSVEASGSADGDTAA